MILRSSCLLLTLVTVVLAATEADAQRRDYLTRSEEDIVRENQEIDLRIEVLVKMVDRRFKTLGVHVPAPKAKKPDETEWGPEPTGSRVEMLWDIKRLIEKAVDDIDNLATRGPDALKTERKKVNIFESAVRSLATAADRWHKTLQPLRERATVDDESIPIASAMDLCVEIIAASKKI